MAIKNKLRTARLPLNLPPAIVGMFRRLNDRIAPNPVYTGDVAAAALIAFASADEDDQRWWLDRVVLAGGQRQDGFIRLVEEAEAGVLMTKFRGHKPEGR